jgi:hypothetical protein
MHTAPAIPGQCVFGRRTGRAGATERDRVRAARCAIGNRERTGQVAGLAWRESHFDSAVRSGCKSRIASVRLSEVSTRGNTGDAKGCSTVVA